MLGRFIPGVVLDQLFRFVGARFRVGQLAGIATVKLCLDRRARTSKRRSRFQRRFRMAKHLKLPETARLAQKMSKFARFSFGECARNSVLRCNINYKTFTIASGAWSGQRFESMHTPCRVRGGPLPGLQSGCREIFASGSPEKILRNAGTGQNSGPGCHLIDPFYLFGCLCYILLTEWPIGALFLQFMKKNARF